MRRRVRVNGSEREVTASTVGALVAELGLEPRAVLVERNGEVVLREEWEGCRLEDGDRVELMRVAAGG